ncbi:MULTISPECIES: cellulose biosynthesis protein BcsN [unclassified Beijerinckia]|uniref:cellulose biosynthesis protein BcsN n=1 Tax=unclassified Beijerinckia TaxID=2638183 RepID=UPI000899E7EE|nr:MULTISPECIES: cellulose biosynthesis protein BcsN [unclassified Beijerinckia]MDH7798190.1 hypothetical protein [Beijerinckia sp. GAS462]SED12259.1 hypothetical protein SAMN05443249_4484 [Beijerinckia sp. 28-YEA-48]
MKHWFVLPLVLLTAACGRSSSEQRFLSRDESTATVATVPVTANPTGDATFTQAVMLLPIEAGAVTRIRERNYPNGTRQDIVMGFDAGTKAENVLEVSIETASSPGGPNMLQAGKPSERGIQSEILSRFRGIQMNIVTKPMQNALGPFGLAIGKQSNGHRCIYAWQWVDNIRDAGPNRSSFARFGSVLGGRAAPASIRVRLCSGTKDLDTLASAVESLQMGEPEALARVLMMDRRNIDPGVAAVDSGRGVAATGITAPVTRVGSLESALSGGRPVTEARQQVAAQPRPARRVARHKPREPQDEPRQAASPPVQQLPPATTLVPQQPPQPSGPRYLGPVPQQAAVPQMAPQAGTYASGAPVPQRLNPNLPAQAYRGPTSQEPYRPPNSRQ